MGSRRPRPAAGAAAATRAATCGSTARCRGAAATQSGPGPSRSRTSNVRRAGRQGAGAWCAQQAIRPCPAGLPWPHGRHFLLLPPPPAGKLLYNEAMSPPAGFPPAVIAKGPSVPFVSGAPLVLHAPPLPGYTLLPGRNQFAFFGGSFNCSFSAACVWEAGGEPGCGAAALLGASRHAHELCVCLRLHAESCTPPPHAPQAGASGGVRGGGHGRRSDSGVL